MVTVAKANVVFYCSSSCICKTAPLVSVMAVAKAAVASTGAAAVVVAVVVASIATLVATV